MIEIHGADVVATGKVMTSIGQNNGTEDGGSRHQKIFGGRDARNTRKILIERTGFPLASLNSPTPRRTQAIFHEQPRAAAVDTDRP